MTNEIFILLLIFQAKHLIADYYLQFPYMYETKGQKTNWFEGLYDHASVHAGFTMIIIFGYMIYDGNIHLNLLMYLILFDFVSHFVVDRWKATREGGPDTVSFWKNLGIDQALHHTVGIIIIWMIT